MLSVLTGSQENFGCSWTHPEKSDEAWLSPKGVPDNAEEHFIPEPSVLKEEAGHGGEHHLLRRLRQEDYRSQDQTGNLRRLVFLKRVGT